jgi:hypothetical protein
VPLPTSVQAAACGARRLLWLLLQARLLGAGPTWVYKSQKASTQASRAGVSGSVCDAPASAAGAPATELTLRSPSGEAPGAVVAAAVVLLEGLLLSRATSASVEDRPALTCSCSVAPVRHSSSAPVAGCSACSRAEAIASCTFSSFKTATNPQPRYTRDTRSMVCTMPMTGQLLPAAVAVGRCECQVIKVGGMVCATVVHWRDPRCTGVPPSQV